MCCFWHRIPMDYSMPLSMPFYQGGKQKWTKHTREEVEVYNNHMLNIRFWFIGQNLQYILLYYLHIYKEKYTCKDYEFCALQKAFHLTQYAYRCKNKLFGFKSCTHIHKPLNQRSQIHTSLMLINGTTVWQ